MVELSLKISKDQQMNQSIGVIDVSFKEALGFVGKQDLFCSLATTKEKKIFISTSIIALG